MLREIVAAEPRNGDAHLLLGTALAIKGFPNESTLHLKEAVRLIPDSAPAHNTLGMALSRFGDLEGARKEFEQAIRLDDKLAQAHINLALVLAQAGKAAKAGTHLNRAIAVLGDTRAAAYPRYLLARLWIEQNEIGKGARELEKAVQLRPDYAEAWSELGRLRRYLFDGPGARAALEKAVALNPRDTTAQYRLGLIYLKNGRAHDAIGHFREALREDPGDRSTLYNLMRVSP